jgi:hypothetical protein
VTSKVWSPLPTTATTEDESTDPAGSLSSTVALMVITPPIMAPRAGTVAVMVRPCVVTHKVTQNHRLSSIHVVGAEGDQLIALQRRREAVEIDVSLVDPRAGRHERDRIPLP